MNTTHQKQRFADRYVFISYAHVDRPIALAIQKRLEAYQYPAKFVAPENMPVHSRYLRRVFVDIEDLSTHTESYKEDLRKELQAARYLIVLCSEASTQSDYVAWEIETFLQEGHSENQILPVVVGGCSDKTIPPLLRNILKHRNVPIWNPGVKTTHASNETALFRIIEFLIKVDGHVLNNRYVQQQKKRVFRISAAITLALSALSLTLFHDLKTEEARRISEQYRAEFEKEVFPYSLVYSYCQNFLFHLPSITIGRTHAVCLTPPNKAAQGTPASNTPPAEPCVLKPAEKCVVIIAMPEHYSELSNQEDDKKAAVKKDLESLGWIATEKSFKGDTLRRNISTLMLDSEDGEIASTNPDFTKVRVFADMASTVNSIKWVVDYLTKKENPYYNHSEEEKRKLALEYIAKFEKCVLDELKSPTINTEIEEAKRPAHVFKGVADVCDIYFVKNRQELKTALEKIKQQF